MPEKKKTIIIFKDGEPKETTDNIRDTAHFIITQIIEAEKRNGDKGFSRLAPFIQENDVNVKITTKELDNDWLLSLVFSTPKSVDYSKKQCYQERVYNLPSTTDKIIYKCKLSGEWRNCEWRQSGNYLWALIKMVNNHYSDLLTIKSDFENFTRN